MESFEFIQDPIILGSLFGGVAGHFFLPLPESLKQNNLNKIVIGVTGGSIGGWMASQLVSDPSNISICVMSIVGVTVLANFLDLV